jgi:hypothetical protein
VAVHYNGSSNQVMVEHKAEVVLFARRVLPPRKEDFRLFFKLIGHQQETLYFACSKSLKRKGV